MFYTRKAGRHSGRPDSRRGVSRPHAARSAAFLAVLAALFAATWLSHIGFGAALAVQAAADSPDPAASFTWYRRSPITLVASSGHP